MIIYTIASKIDVRVCKPLVVSLRPSEERMNNVILWTLSIKFGKIEQL